MSNSFRFKALEKNLNQQYSFYSQQRINIWGGYHPTIRLNPVEGRGEFYSIIKVIEVKS